MTDIVDKATRSRMMAGIRGKNTQPELLIRRFLHSSGFRYRLHAPKLAGKPDIVLPRYKTAIFVHGCFWHRHDGCKYATNPAQNRENWQEKFRENVERDHRNIRLLMEQKWRVIVIWECGIRHENSDFLWLANEITQGCKDYVEWPSRQEPTPA